MTFKTGNRRPEIGTIRQEPERSGAGKKQSRGTVPGRCGGQRRVRAASSFWSPVSGFEKTPVSGFEWFAGIPLRAIRGRLGDRVYKTYGDKIIVTRVPRFDGHVPSVAQRERRARMRAATAFAKAVYADPAAKAVYVAAARSLGCQPFRLAVSDFLQGRIRVPTPSKNELLTRATPPRSTQRTCCRAATHPNQPHAMDAKFAKERALGELRDLGVRLDSAQRGTQPDRVMPEHVTKAALRVPV